MLVAAIIIILELQIWKGPHGPLRSVPVREAQWRIELPVLSSAARSLNHWAIQQFSVLIWKIIVSSSPLLFLLFQGICFIYGSSRWCQSSGQMANKHNCNWQVSLVQLTQKPTLRHLKALLGSVSACFSHLQVWLQLSVVAGWTVVLSPGWGMCSWCEAFSSMDGCITALCLSHKDWTLCVLQMLLEWLY